ncbi:unnamed protein product [Miscanthus lutarioriparius]|uniref:NB-ARC domain-containing protein n=1 Tax=Miscanthus lutarioriparius TaxID=422564 RepID=A0A811NSZ9_9POAL|nr:unnamed protein product [Miscanthus lutarioriparius]
MEMLLSALLGEGITRSLNFFISKSSKLQPHNVEDCFHRVLLRAQVIIDEATGRHITNRAMLQQLDMLRDAMHQGHYTLDTFRYQSHEEDTKDHVVLPIVGPRKVGKSTLVAHICYDKRVRDQFSEIMFLSDNDFKSDKLTYLGEGCLKKYQNSTLNKDGRMRVVIESTGDFNEEEWKRMYVTCKRYMKSGSKIIITSWYDKITKLGTTRAVTLKHLSDEAYWYFFKTLTFGSTDPVMHPRLTCLAMEIARILKRCFFWCYRENQLSKGQL